MPQPVSRISNPEFRIFLKNTTPRLDSVLQDCYNTRAMGQQLRVRVKRKALKRRKKRLKEQSTAGKAKAAAKSAA